MLTPETIDRLNKVNDLLLSFDTTMSDIGSVDPYLTNARTYMNYVIKEASLDVLKRN